MTHYETMLRALKRPKLLIRAARSGASRYRREKHAKLASAGGKDHSKFFSELMEQERDLEWNRRSGGSDYNVQKHIIVLSALIVEARLAPAP